MQDKNVIVSGRGTYFDREIMTDQYERAKENGDKLTEADENKVLTEAERYGYGASASNVYELDGHYFVRCHRYNTCD